MSDRQQYEDVLRICQAPIFYHLEWLDAVTIGDWHSKVLKDSSNSPQVAFPYLKKKSIFGDILVSPIYTPFLGPLIPHQNEKKTTAYKRGMEQVQAVIDFCQQFAEVSFRLSPGFEYWLPFRWAGYQINPRMTYQVKPASEDILWEQLDAKVRTDIRKAQSKSELVLVKDISTQEVFDLYSKVFERKGGEVPMKRDWFEKFDRHLRSAGLSRVLGARTSDGTLAAMVYIVGDSYSDYLFLTGFSPELRKTSALSLLIWESIKEASLNKKVFDFEGSIIPSIESFFRGFGGEQVIYFEVRKTNNLILRILRKIREALA